ncbi:MAG: YqiA/YcfP family alpha/beta fold hydrolase [Campylobacterota bacterium]|nr:YqiA/YcfP family alpha/beta fold hydrolase [Campylobacterota bacterium]
MITIYIHGFGGSGQGQKATAFRKYYKSKNKAFFAPSLSHIPDLAVTTLEEFIESYKGRVNLIGSSLGGYYALYLAVKYDLKAVVLNPAVDPVDTVSLILHNNPKYYEGYNFILKDEHIKMLHKYNTTLAKPKNILTMLQKGDELLDYKQAQNYLKDTNLKVQEGGSHFFEGLEDHFETIEEFFS